MQSPLSRKYSQADLDLTEKYRQAIACGYSAALIDEDGYLFDAKNWQDDVLCLKLKADAWQKHVADEHIGGVLMWINDPDLVDPINFVMTLAQDSRRQLYVSWTKKAADRLRLVIGASVPVKT